MEHHERMTETKMGFENIRELVEKQIAENEKQEKEEKEGGSLGVECILIEAADAMKDFKDIGDKDDSMDVEKMIADLNADQKRVFDRVT